MSAQLAHRVPIIVAAIAAAKIAANSRSSTAKARPQPREASIESANNSRRPGSVHGAFICRWAVPLTITALARRGAILDGHGQTSSLFREPQ